MSYLIIGFIFGLFIAVDLFVAYKLGKIAGRRELSGTGREGLRLIKHGASQTNGQLVNFKSIEEVQ